MVPMTMDVIKGGIIDILPMSAFTDRGGSFEQLAAKGAFIDLYPFMENDPEINLDTLNAHILSLAETDGKLVYLPTHFCIDTLIGPARYVGTKENWTLDDFKEKWAERPEGATINGVTERDYVYREILRGNIGNFIDYKNATCSFDSQEFLDIIEFLETFPANNGWVEHIHSSETILFLQSGYITGFMDYHGRMLGDRFIFTGEKDEMTLVGYPSNDGSGAMITFEGTPIGICQSASPEKQAAAWEFIRTLVDYDFQYEEAHLYDEWFTLDDGTEVFQCNQSGFPMNNAVYEKLADEWIHMENQNIQSVQGNKVDFGWLTQEEYETLTHYISTVNRAETHLDDDLWNIINDEMMIFCGGEYTPQQLCDMIQNRVSIMVSEKS